MVKGYYINLAEDEEKRAAFELNLQQYALAEYQRFDALNKNTDLHPGMMLRGPEKACFLSHFTLIQNHDPKSGMLHVLEDDARLNDKIREVHKALEKLKPELWDIVLTDVLVQAPPSFFSGFQAPMEAWRKTGRVQFYNMHQRKLTGATSYFINPASHNKVKELIEKNLTGKFPFDLLLRKLADTKQLKILVTLPFFTYPQFFKEQTSIRRLTSLEQILMKLRESFWVDANLLKIREEMRAFKKPDAGSLHREIYGEFIQCILETKEMKLPFPG